MLKVSLVTLLDMPVGVFSNMLGYLSGRYSHLMAVLEWASIEAMAVRNLQFVEKLDCTVHRFCCSVAALAAALFDALGFVGMVF